MTDYIKEVLDVVKAQAGVRNMTDQEAASLFDTIYERVKSAVGSERQLQALQEADERLPADSSPEPEKAAGETVASAEPATLEQPEAVSPESIQPEAELSESVQGDGDSEQQSITPEESIGENSITCLECGQEFRTLGKKHLAKHGLTPAEYRKKWGLPRKQSLAAKYLSRERSKRMRETTLWEKRQFAHTGV